MTKERISTTDLLKLLGDSNADWVEACIQKGVLRATHILWLEGDTVHDTGIDDEEAEWSKDEFTARYEHTLWTIEGVSH